MSKKIFIFFFIISLLLILYVFFRSEISWSGQRRDYYLNYYLLGISILIFSVFNLFFNEKLSKIVLIIFFSNHTNIKKFYPFGDFGHFTEYGYKEISKFITNEIEGWFLNN